MHEINDCDHQNTVFETYKFFKIKIGMLPENNCHVAKVLKGG